MNKRNGWLCFNMAPHFSACVFGICLVLLLFFSAVPASCQDECQLIMGWEPWEPFQQPDAEGNLTGLDIEIARAVTERIPCKLTFREVPWVRLMYEVEFGRISLAAGVTRTPEREAFAYFSAPYRKESFVLYVRKGESAKFTLNSLADIPRANFQLGVTAGYYYGEQYTELSADPTFQNFIQEVAQDSLHYAKLIRGRIDGFLAEPIVATVELRKQGLLDQVEIYPLDIYATDICMMFSKKSVTPEIVQQFNASLAAIKADGTYDAILSKYLQ